MNVADVMLPFVELKLLKYLGHRWCTPSVLAACYWVALPRGGVMTLRVFTFLLRVICQTLFSLTPNVPLEIRAKLSGLQPCD